MITYPYYQFCVKKNGQILIGSQNNGFYVYNPISNECSTYLIEDKTEFSIVSNTINCIYKDRDDSYWLCTQFGGICFFNERDLSLKYEYIGKSEKSTLNCGVISGFSEDKNGNIWISTDGGGIAIMDRKENIITNFCPSNNSIPKNITDIFTDKNGIIWTTAWDGKVFTINPLDKTVSFPNSKNTLINYKGIFIDSKNRKWLFPLFDFVQIINNSNTEVFTNEHQGNIHSDIFYKGLLIDATEDINPHCSKISINNYILMNCNLID